MKQKLIITALLLAGLFISEEMQAKEPKENKSEKTNVPTVTVHGKYKGRSHDGSGGITFRCGRQQSLTCYAVTVDGGGLLIELGDGVILRGTVLPPVVTGTDIHPVSNEPIDTYYYNFGSPLEILNASNGEWTTLPEQNIWVNE
jgi:hypothetical protein